ncbi:MAG TPA: trigger factor, partial [Bacilli bacterium]
KDIKVTFPENYQAEHLAGKEVLFKVRLHDIKRKILPALDDEFAKDVSEFDTLEEYKQDIAQKIKEKKEKENKFYIEATVIEKASEVADLDIPQVMINNELEQMLQEFGTRLKKQGMALEQYYQFSGQDEAALRAQMQGDAEKRVRNNLVLEAIAKEENVSVTDEEINEELEKMSLIYQKPADELLAILSANGNLIDLKYDLVARKTVKFLVEHSKKVPDAEVA